MRDTPSTSRYAEIREVPGMAGRLNGSNPGFTSWAGPGEPGVLVVHPTIAVAPLLP